MYRYNAFGQSMEDFDAEKSGARIGRRIRAIRTEQGLSQGELGEKVGLNANRIQQYENGARKPKLPLVKQIAEALEVEASSILDPQVSSYTGAMYAFFEMENLYDLRLKEVDGQICICFGEGMLDVRVGAMNKHLKQWFERRKKLEEDLLNAETEKEKKDILYDYHMWERNFPFSTDKNADSKSERERKARIAHEMERRLNK